MSKKAGLITLCICSLVMTGCSARTENAMDMLRGFISWMRKDYQQAIVSFLTVTGRAEKTDDKTAKEYGLYALATTYIVQNEGDAALLRLGEIPVDTSPDIRFGALYNGGIIAWNKGYFPEAAACFREALRLNPSNINAKINLELSLQMTETAASSGSKETSPAVESEENRGIEDTLFSIVKAKELNQWKSREDTEKHSDILDY